MSKLEGLCQEIYNNHQTAFRRHENLGSTVSNFVDVEGILIGLVATDQQVKFND